MGDQEGPRVRRKRPPGMGKGNDPRPSLPRTKEESFKWKARPEGDMFEGGINPDGSALDGPAAELIRCGWSFVVLCQNTGTVIASAFALPPPPPWITCIGGAQAWAMLQAALRTLPGVSRFKGDC